MNYIKQVFDATNLDMAKNICLSKDDRYPNKFEEETQFLINFIKERQIINNNTRVGDFGCGVGRVSKEIIDNFNCNVTGFDISQHMLLLAEQYVENPKKFRAQKYKKNYEWIKKSFDVFIASFVLQHSEHPAEDVDFIHKNLSKGGILILINEPERLLPIDIKNGYAVWYDDKINIIELVSKKFKNLGYYSYYKRDIKCLSLWEKI
jgi:2-polyprenyl-3-methyl-5-hydroxy-6-metoxy-1,4-benzoquinol methylase